jgi:hypothetical protein
MAAIASAELITDLEHAVQASPGRTDHLLGGVANLQPGANAAMREAG